MPGFDDLKKFAEEHDKQLDEVLEKAGDAAEKKFGHDEQIEKVVDQLKERTGGGDHSTDHGSR